jgi:carbon storage regulator
MLILDRKVNQSIMIGNIEVVITEVKGDHVKLGVSAPRYVPVHRKEIYELIKSQNGDAAKSILPDLTKLREIFSI